MSKEKPKKLKVKVTDIVRRKKADPAAAVPGFLEPAEPTEADRMLPSMEPVAPPEEIKERPEPTPPVVAPIPPTPPLREEETLPESKVSRLEALQLEEQERFHTEQERKRRSGSKLTRITLSVVALIALGGVAYSAFEILPRATVEITMAKIPFSFAEAITASTKAAAVDLSSRTIPAQIFTTNKNFTLAFKASGKKNVSDYAKGIIVITNAYSSAPQSLVARTRFADPKGNVFRLMEAVTVPGALVQNGKLTPRTIEAKVIADKPGPSYNIPPSHFTIPGFAGSSKYAGFSADSKEPMTGGFIGERPYPTASDIVAAQAAAREGARKNLDSFLSLQIPQDLKVIDDSRQFSIIKETPSTDVDADGNFSYFIDARDSAIAFREPDVLALLAEIARAATGKNNLEAKNYTLDYGGPKVDVGGGKMIFIPDFKGQMWAPIRADDVEQAIRGKSEAEVRGYLLSIPDRERTTVTFWPFWVSSVPEDARRLEIEIE